MASTRKHRLDRWTGGYNNDADNSFNQPATSLRGFTDEKGEVNGSAIVRGRSLYEEEKSRRKQMH